MVVKCLFSKDPSFFILLLLSFAIDLCQQNLFLVLSAESLCDSFNVNILLQDSKNHWLIHQFSKENN